MNQIERKQEIKQFFQDHKVIFKRIRDNRGRAIACLLAYKDEDEVVRIGWSKWNSKLDRMDQDFGTYVAIQRAKAKVVHTKLPYIIGKELDRFVDRARRYYKTQAVYV